MFSSNRFQQYTFLFWCEPSWHSDFQLHFHLPSSLKSMYIYDRINTSSGKDTVARYLFRAFLNRKSCPISISACNRTGSLEDASGTTGARSHYANSERYFFLRGKVYATGHRSFSFVTARFKFQVRWRHKASDQKARFHHGTKCAYARIWIHQPSTLYAITTPRISTVAVIEICVKR